MHSIQQDEKELFEALSLEAITNTFQSTKKKNISKFVRLLRRR
ncbi:hypothetical protein [Sporosarcina jiandibaonis]|nr:hypothetical protein [Sporosarcina jiandibaonis]